MVVTDITSVTDIAVSCKITKASEPETYLEPCQTPMMEFYYKNSEWLKVANYFRKSVSS